MRQVPIKTPEEIEIIAENGEILHNVLSTLEKEIRPGITSLFLDELAEDLIKQAGATASFKGYQGFPASICASINEEVVHGIPDERELKNGDIISIDAGVYKNDFHSDSAITVPVGTISDKTQKLLDVTRKSLYRGIKALKPGIKLGYLGHVIQTYIEKNNYGVVRELVGHGIGREIHENPAIPNYGNRNNGIKVEKGMVFAIEPMVTIGDYHVDIGREEWVVTTVDGSLSAHYEHTVAITENGARILT